MRPVIGIPVQELLRKATDVEGAVKLIVVRGLRTFEDENSNWMVDQVVRSFRRAVPDVALSDNAVASYNILPNVSNDPEDSLFAPEDQFPIMLRAIKQCDVALFSCRESFGLPDSNTVKVIERLSYLAKEKKDEAVTSQDKVRPYFENKPVGIVVCGGCGSYNAALTLAGAFSKLGFNIVPKGIVSWDVHRGDPFKSDKLSACLEQLARNLADQYKATSK